MTDQATVAPEPKKADEHSGPKTARQSEYNKKIGIIFVHGIGEQRRFTHLDGEVRPLLEALKRGGATVTTEISGGTASTLRAEQDTWSTHDGAPVRAFVDDPTHGKCRLDFHEVWWADVNEEYTFKKQVLFWLWGLGMWWIPFQPTGRATGVTRLPEFPGAKDASERISKRIFRERKGDPKSVRIQLYLVSNLFLMGAFSIGLVAYVAKRVFGYEPPDFVRVLVNYLSAVRLYSQAERAGGGFLDAYKEPPRVSVRRRMIRTIADVAALDYERWYVFGHSLGSVVAFNGVMENNLAIPNYLDEPRWKKLSDKGWAGTGTRGERVRGPMLPARPLWLGETDVVYRDKLFSRFAGLLTYGSPLDKFAMLWKGQVPINCGEPIKYVPPDASGRSKKPEWINVYDQTDPVGASLQAFNPKNDRENILSPANYGYRAGDVWLVSHLEYLKVHPGKTDELSDALMKWVLSGETFQQGRSDSWYEPEGEVHWKRRRSRWFQQWAGYFLLVALAAITLPSLLKGIGQLAGKAFELSPSFPQVIAEPVTVVFDKIKTFVTWCADGFASAGAWLSGIFEKYLWGWVADILSSGFAGYFVLAIFAVALVTAIAGVIGRVWGFDAPDKNTR